MTGSSTEVIAVDIGGTSIKAARMRADGQIVARVSAPTPTAGGSEVFEATCSLIDSFEPGTDDVRALGVVAPGTISGGVVEFAPNIGWREFPLTSLLSQRYAKPIAIGHDVAAAAIGDATFGTRSADALFVALGTGIAVAHVRGGAVQPGATNRAGELGHAVLRPDGEPCRCGQRGCLEVYASAAAITRRYNALTGRTVTDAATVIALVPTDTAARQVWHDAIDLLATALASAICLIDPAAVVLGGGLSLTGDTLVDELKSAIGERLTWRPVPLIEATPLGTDAGLAGACVLAQQACLTSEFEPGRKVSAP